ncbi:hypothetical protein BDR07DRAFT_1425152 [Suillus spraguei]|nr:hypothetical protein BDR07DRAFT_1425152 [Suillus spraguei]
MIDLPARIKLQLEARETIERKDVFEKPPIPSNTQTLFLATLITTVESAVRSGSRKSSKACARKALPRSEIADSTEGIPSPGSIVCLKTSVCVVGSTSSPFPAVSKLAPSSGHTTIGVNEVTRRLESQLKSVRHSVMLTTTVRPESNPLGDRQPLKWIVLPKGSESALAQALGLRRAAVIAVHDDAPYLPIFSRYASICTCNQRTLACTFSPAQFSEMLDSHSYQKLRTTAPKDMQSAKEQRVKARAAAKKNGAKFKPKKCLLTTAGPDT